MLGLSGVLSGGRCGASTINNGALSPIQVGGPALPTVHVNLRSLQLQQYASLDALSTYESVTLDEQLVLNNLHNSNLRPDIGWIFPQTYDAIYGQGALAKDADKITLVHMRSAHTCAHMHTLGSY